jgi:hypothetical protein
MPLRLPEISANLLIVPKKKFEKISLNNITLTSGIGSAQLRANFKTPNKMYSYEGAKILYHDFHTCPSESAILH